MLELVHQLEFEKLVFVTLTYPGAFPTDGRETKKHLRRFRARIERKFGKLKVLWRLEFQKRGAPHFHLLLMDPPWIDKEWLSKTWYECVGSHDPKHLKRGTNIVGVARKGENKKVIAYVGKYISKVDGKERESTNEWTGRYYGKWNYERPVPIEVELDPGQAIQFVTGIVSDRRRNSPYDPRDYTRCSLFGGSVGSDIFSRECIRLAKEVRGTRKTGKLDS